MPWWWPFAKELSKEDKRKLLLDAKTYLEEIERIQKNNRYSYRDGWRIIIKIRKIIANIQKILDQTKTPGMEGTLAGGMTLCYSILDFGPLADDKIKKYKDDDLKKLRRYIEQAIEINDST